jgi:amino-acid N-acetyltransferase
VTPLVIHDPLTFRVAKPADISIIVKLLQENGLPSEDISEKLDCMILALQHDLLAGIGGLEVHGEYGLLRSIVTTERFRGLGFGKRLVEYLLVMARERGVDRVYLLTTTADQYFAKIGFEQAERSDVPSEIQATSEFATLCPADASCMMMKL